MRTEIPSLSKSRFLSGHQCPKRLWLECYGRELAAEADPWTRAMLEAGRAVGALARERFPGGRLVSEGHLDHERAIEATRALLADPSVPAIYEAAFTDDDVRIRADVLARTADGGFDLFEVKATTRVKPEHEWDLAVQVRVLEGAGVPVRRAHLLHLSRDYVHGGGEWDLAALFAAVDLTDAVRSLLPDVGRALAAFRETLRAPAPPPVAVGPHCASPWVCPFHAHCHAGRPEFPVEELPGIGRRLRERLALLGIDDLREVPADLDGVSPLQARAVDAVRGGRRFHDPAIAVALSAARFPVHFLDFETLQPALPLFPGTRPYDVIPFQWSCHALSESGWVRHHEFLDDGAGDPRRRFAQSLLEAMGEGGSVVVYSGYEERRLLDLEAALPDLAPRLARLRARLLDLLPLIRGHVYDPVFHGSFSLKAVLPALLPGLGWDDLAIGDGGLASLAFLELRDPATPADRAAAIRADLRAYCRRDTEALLELFRALR